MSSRHREPPVVPRCGSRRRALLVKSLVGRYPAVSSTMVEATTNLPHHRRPSQNFLDHCETVPFHHMEADVFLGAKLSACAGSEGDDAGGEGPRLGQPRVEGFGERREVQGSAAKDDRGRYSSIRSSAMAAAARPAPPMDTTPSPGWSRSRPTSVAM